MTSHVTVYALLRVVLCFALSLGRRHFESFPEFCPILAVIGMAFLASRFGCVLRCDL